MRIVACMPARNEGWCIGLSARVALAWCDALVVGLHECDDDTEAVVDGIDGEISKLRFAGRLWDEMPQRQRMLIEARRIGATHIAIVDADEVLTGNLLAVIRGYVEGLRAGRMLDLPGYNLRGGIDQYHVNGVWGRRWFSTAFKDHPQLHWSGDQYHHREPFGMSLVACQPVTQNAGGTMHLWGASERRLRAKHAWYKMLEALRWPDKPRREIDRYYSMAIWPGAAPQFDRNWRYAPVPTGWWKPHVEARQYLNLDAEPWQEAEVRRLWREDGPAKFVGLNLYGVEVSADPASILCREEAS